MSRADEPASHTLFDVAMVVIFIVRRYWLNVVARRRALEAWRLASRGRIGGEEGSKNGNAVHDRREK